MANENDAAESGETRRPRNIPVELPALIASGQSFASIASIYGVHRDTVARWAERPDVIEGVEALAAVAMRAARARIRAMTEKALDTLAEVMDDADEAPSRVSAAKAVLERVLPSLQGVEVHGGVTVKTEPADLSDDEIEARHAALRERLSKAV